MASVKRPYDRVVERITGWINGPTVDDTVGRKTIEPRELDPFVEDPLAYQRAEALVEARRNESDDRRANLVL
ncbi:MAG: hypothetical protein ACKO5K_07590 [Armatimonadota bacterium]